MKKAFDGKGGLPALKRFLPLLSLAAAAILLIFLVRSGLTDIIGAFRRAGWLLLILAPLHIITVALDSQGWRALLIALSKRISRGYLIWAAAVRNATQSLIPIGIGDVISGARLLVLRDIRLPAGVASIIAEDSLMVLGELLFVLIGIGTYVLFFPASARFLLILAPILALAFIGAGLIIWAQMDGRVLAKLNALAEHVLDTERHGKLAAAPLSVRDSLQAIYRRPQAPMHCLKWQVASLFSEAAELWIIMVIMGVPANFYFALLLQSLGRLTRSIAFFLPAGLGVQEGLYALIAPLGGLSPGFGIALSLATRFRDISFGIPALLSWQALEIRQRKKRGQGLGE